MVYVLRLPRCVCVYYRKATEAKRELEKAFSAGDEGEDEDEPPVGVPLKSPPSRVLKGGLKVKDT